MRRSKNNLKYTKRIKRKNSYRSPICKKHKTKQKWYSAHQSLDPLHKDYSPKESEKTEDNKHWKVMPKDSCEVYRARWKRQQTGIKIKPANQIIDQDEEY